MENKDKIIYTKYSNDRKKEFRILTQIVDDGKKRFIRKMATDKSAMTHISNMVLHEKSLSTMFSGSKFAVNKIIAQGENFVDFEYIEGTSYDKFLDGFLKKDDEAGFKNAAADFFAELDKLATVEFHQNEETIEVFGENAFEEGEKAIPVGNIDLIFQNVIVGNDGTWNVIDYEWIFDFPIPAKYLKWRSLYNLSVFSYYFASLPLQKLFSLFLISEEDWEKFKNIEYKGFQKSVGSGLYFGARVPFLRKQILNPYAVGQNDCIDVFYDTGNGFSESEKDIFYQFPFVIYPKENLRALRIDPSCSYCIVRIVSIKADDTELSFHSNAYREDNSVLYFDTADPQVYIELPENPVQSFSFNMQVFRLDEQSALAIKAEHEESAARAAVIENLRAVAADFRNQLQQQIQQADIAIQQKQRELSSLYASRSWRLTKPVRFAGRIIRKILGRR